MIGVGLVGLGEVGQVHLAGLRESPHVDVVSLVDLDADLVARSRQQERVAESFDALLLDPDVSVVDICLPHNLHLPFALRAIESGRHVLLEKPLAVSVDDCTRIIEAAEAAGVSVGVSHNQLMYEPLQRLGSMVDEGTLGDLLTLRARLAIGGKYGEWRSDPEQAGGGLLMDAGVHRVYVLERLGGPVRAITAVMDQPQRENTYSIVLEFVSGAIGTIDATYNGPDGLFDDQVEVVGTKAIARMAGCEALFEGYTSEPALQVWGGGAWTEYASANDWAGSVKASVGAYCAAVASGSRPPIDGTDGRRTVALIEAAYESARTGSRVEIEPS